MYFRELLLLYLPFYVSLHGRWNGTGVSATDSYLTSPRFESLILLHGQKANENDPNEDWYVNNFRHHYITKKCIVTWLR